MDKSRLAVSIGLTALLTASGCYALPPSGHVDWNALPAHGVHVSGVERCNHRGALGVHDVILEIDSAPVATTAEAYSALGDGKRHRAFVYSKGGRDDYKTVSVQLEAEHDVNFVSMLELQQTPTQGRGEMWGFAVRGDLWVSPRKQISLPSFLWGELYVMILLDDSDAETKRAVVHALTEWKERSERATYPFQVLLVKVQKSAENHSVAWSGLETLRAEISDKSVLVSLEHFEAGRNAGRKPQVSAGFERVPAVVVVDQHGAIRWHSDPLTGVFSGEPLDFPQLLVQALDFAAGGHPK